MDYDWSALLEILGWTVLAVVVTVWVVMGFGIGVIWGGASQRTNSVILAAIYGMIMAPPIVFYWVFGPILDPVLLPVSRWWRRVTYVPPKPPPPPPPKWYPRARPPQPDGEDWRFDYESWQWVKKTLDK